MTNQKMNQKTDQKPEQKASQQSDQKVSQETNQKASQKTDQKPEQKASQKTNQNKKPDGVKYIPAKRIAAVVLIAAAAAVVLIAGYLYWNLGQSGDKAEKIISSMEKRIPNLGVESEEATGFGRDPLAALTIDGIDIVGLLEVPSADIKVPVMAKGEKAPGLASWKSGSPVKGKFLIYGSMKDSFLTLPQAKPGDSCFFTDIDGMRYKYTVTTQFHLKKWDKQNYDLMLAYYTDEDTRFMVGCGRS